MTYIGIFLLVVVAAKLIYWFVAKMLWQEEPKADEVYTVRTSDGWRIKLYRRFNAECIGEPIFFCHGLTGNPFNFLYPRDVSPVDTLVDQGFDCWVIDLRGNRRSEPPIGTSRYSGTFRDYYAKDIPAALEQIQTITGYDKVHWIGHSMGGMLLYAYLITRGSDRIATGTTLGSPPGFKNSETRIMHKVIWFATTFPFLAERYLHGLAPLTQLETREDSPLPLNGQNMSKEVWYFNTFELPPTAVTKELTDCGSRKVWILKEDNLNMENLLPSIDIPLHLLAAPLDTLGSQRAIETFFDEVASTDKTLTVLSRANGNEFDYDHIDLAFGKNAAKEVFEPIGRWIQDRAIGQVARPTKKKAATPRKTCKPVVAKVIADPPKAKAADTTVSASESTLWGKALEDASSILSSLDGDTPGIAPKKKKATPRKKPVKKPAAKKKAAPKKKVAAKKTATKKTSSKKKPKSKKDPVKKKAVKKKTSKKNTPPKKKDTDKKKVTTNKKSTSKKDAKTKKKSSSKKPAKKKTSPKNKISDTKKKTKKKK